MTTPPPVPAGCEAYTAKSGCRVLRIHYSSDPDKTPEWAAKAKVGIPSREWKRELELSFDVFDGEPVFADYSDAVHCPLYLQHNDWDLKKGSRYILGIDCGQTLFPAAVLLEVGPPPFYQLAAIFEITHDGAEPMSQFCPRVLSILQKRFPGFWDDIQWVGDQTVTQRSGANGRSAWDEARKFGIDIKPMTNNLHARLGAVVWALTDWIDQDSPRFFLNGKNCPTLLAAMRGGYRLRPPVGKEATSKDLLLPVKDKFSHVSDALQYCIMEAQKMIKRTGNQVRKLTSYGSPRRHD